MLCIAKNPEGLVCLCSPPTSEVPGGLYRHSLRVGHVQIHSTVTDSSTGFCSLGCLPLPAVVSRSAREHRAMLGRQACHLQWSSPTHIPPQYIAINPRRSVSLRRSFEASMAILQEECFLVLPLIALRQSSCFFHTYPTHLRSYRKYIFKTRTTSTRADMM